MFGPNLTALASLLTGAFHLSRRSALEVPDAVFGCPMSLGGLASCEEAASESLAEPASEIREAVLFRNNRVRFPRMQIVSPQRRAAIRHGRLRWFRETLRRSGDCAWKILPSPMLEISSSHGSRHKAGQAECSGQDGERGIRKRKS
jgi:hypothetical protein